LDATVEKSPRSLGQRFSNWTRKNLLTHLAQKLKTTVAECTVGRHLRRLGWTLVRPTLCVKSPDPNYALKVAQLEALKGRASRGEITLLYEDELDLNLLPGVIRCWTRVGQQHQVLTPGINQKRYGFGAANWIDGSMVTHIGERKDSVGFCALVESIVSRYCPGATWDGPRVVLVVDNYIIHGSKLTQQTLQKYADRLEVFRLPTYSPKLNPIELLWKHLRSKVTHNHLFANMEELLVAVNQFFADLVDDHGRVLSIIGSRSDRHTIPNNLCSVI
jgi:hypothetical protein